MNKKHFITLSCVFFITGMIFLYIITRYPSLLDEYRSEISANGERIVKITGDYQSARDLQWKNLAGLLKIINIKYPDLAVFAVADAGNQILIAEKNSRHIEKQKTFDKITEDFKSGRLNNGDKGFFKKWYGGKEFLVSQRPIPGGKALVLFPAGPDMETLIRMLLELIIISVLCTALHGILYLSLQKRGKLDIREEYSVRNRPREKNEIPDAETPSDLTNIAVDSLNEYVMKLFMAIRDRFAPRLLSLYLVQTNNRLEKIYEMQGNSFLKIESSDFDCIDMDNEIGVELKNGSTLMLDGSRKLLIPVLFRSSLLGLLVLLRDECFTGTEVRDIKDGLSDITLFLSEYITMKDVIVDRESGLYSKTYFKLKYDEEKKRSKKQLTPFSVLILSPFGNTMNSTFPTPGEYIKRISTRINDTLKDDFILSRYDDCLSILLPGRSQEKARDTAQKLIQSLDNYRIKIDRNTLTLKPYIGLASSDNGLYGEDLIERAEENLYHALSKDDSNVQSAHFKKV